MQLLEPGTTCFPVFESLHISGYGLYKGKDGADDFVWNFRRGPNALIGVNGLGKSTLVTMLFRLITGPFDLNRRALEGELGQPDTAPVSVPDRRMFARRVADQAVNATATLNLRFGARLVSITRKLSDLTLTAFSIDGLTEPTGEDDRVLYQDTIASLVGVGSFFDVLIILRFLVFVFEDRRSLVWDESAQRQIFRAILSAPEASRRSLEIQREIVEADSSARNIRVQLNKAKNALNQAVAQAQAKDSSLAQLFVAEKSIQGIQDRRASVVRNIEDLDSERIQERRARMRAEHERDRLLGEIDGAKLRLISHLFSKLPPAARLIMNRGTETGMCACCGQRAPEMVARIENALKAQQCPYCEQALPAEDQPTYEILDKTRVEKLEADHSKAAIQAATATARVMELESNIASERGVLSEIERDFASTSHRYDQLRRSVAVEPEDIMRRRVSVDALDDIMTDALSRQRNAENNLSSLVEQLESRVSSLQEDIASRFDKYAGTFMHEECHLTYIARDERIGQEGLRFRFPSFQVALSGGAVAGQTLRSNPEAVSLSQREFIDIAFRMALLDSAASVPGATLVVDTPEAGLDFLFAERAGLQFLEFAPPHSAKSTVLTSNLVSDHLLKAVLRDNIGPSNRRSHLLNLIDHAAPTAAVVIDRPRYVAFVEDIINA